MYSQHSQTLLLRLLSRLSFSSSGSAEQKREQTDTQSDSGFTSKKRTKQTLWMNRFINNKLIRSVSTNRDFRKLWSSSRDLLSSQTVIRLCIRFPLTLTSPLMTDFVRLSLGPVLLFPELWHSRFIDWRTFNLYLLISFVIFRAKRCKHSVLKREDLLLFFVSCDR